MYLPPAGIDLVFSLIFGKEYVFDFPFCPNCPPDAFRLKKTHLNKSFAAFVGAPRQFLEALPLVPDNLAAEMSRGLIRRSLEWF